MKITVFGAGGIGGYFGARLATGGAEVHLIARGSHLEALRAQGLRVASVNGNVHVKPPATDDPSAVGASDVVLFCVKSTDTVSAAPKLAPLIKDGTAVITLQNGVDNEERLASIIGREHVVGGVAYILATIAEPGSIQHEGALARVVFGELDGNATPRLEAFHAACVAGAIDAAISNEIHVELWKKFAMICAAAGLTAAVRLPLGAIRDSAASFATYRRIAEEVAALGRARGVPLPDTLVDDILATARKLPAEWYSSLHYDLTHDKPMELDALHGTVVRLARESGIDVPANEAIYGVLDPWAMRNRSLK